MGRIWCGSTIACRKTFLAAGVRGVMVISVPSSVTETSVILKGYNKLRVKSGVFTRIAMGITKNSGFANHVIEVRMNMTMNPEFGLHLYNDVIQR